MVLSIQLYNSVFLDCEFNSSRVLWEGSLRVRKGSSAGVQSTYQEISTHFGVILLLFIADVYYDNLN